MGGDLNCDIARDVPQTHALMEFIERENFYLALNNGNSSVTHTHESLSTIDHFMVTPNLSDFITKYETLETVNNFSDHIPIILHMDIDIEYLQTVKRPISPSVSWPQCSKEQITEYQGGIDDQLDRTELDFEVFACRDPNVVYTMIKLETGLTPSPPDFLKILSIIPDYHVILISLPSLLIYIYIHFKNIFNGHFRSNIALLSTRRL